MKKRILSVVLATAMVVGSSMTVFAAGEDNNSVSKNEAVVGSGEVSMTSTLGEALISVQITTDGKVIANPYKLTTETVSSSETLKISKITFENKSNTPIEIGLKGAVEMVKPYDASATSATKVTIGSDKKTVETATTKMVFVQAEVAKSNDNTKYILNTKRQPMTLVYAAKAVAIEKNPVLAAKDANLTGTLEGAATSMDVILTGVTSASPTSKWDAVNDQFKVVTTYDIRMATTAPSKFEAAGSTATP